MRISTTVCRCARYMYNVFAKFAVHNKLCLYLTDEMACTSQHYCMQMCNVLVQGGC